jgi:hypothetical protein
MIASFPRWTALAGAAPALLALAADSTVVGNLALGLAGLALSRASQPHTPDAQRRLKCQRAKRA